MKCFIDTNVLIDFLLQRQPFYEPAAALLTMADEGRIEAAVSALSIVTSQFICCERAKMPLNVWTGKLTVLEDFMEIVSVDGEDVMEACASDWKDFEDSVQYNVARKALCDVIVTRNPKDFVLSDIPVCAPDDILDIRKT